MNKLLEAYSGDRASGYDNRRSKSSRWKAEISAFEAMLANSQAVRVLDCPFGTGRWIPQYADRGLEVLGVDLSAGMLAEAENKIATLTKPQQSRFKLQEKSVFDLVPSDFTDQPDLIVCVRFLNWIAAPEVEKVLRLLSDFGSGELIVGVSVVPKAASRLGRIWYKKSLNLINNRRPERPKQYVHDEVWFLSLLDANGWQVVEQRRTMKRNSRINYFYHCARD